jgi:hypothetical protein
MSTKFKNFYKKLPPWWGESPRVGMEPTAREDTHTATKDGSLMDMQELDMLDDDLLGRMAHATSFAEWWDLHERREALRIQRDSITAQPV